MVKNKTYFLMDNFFKTIHYNNELNLIIIAQFYEPLVADEANKSVEIRVDTRIPTGIKVKYNKPDVFILDKIKKEILIVEVGITRFDNLRAVETEKKHKYDLLANHCGAMNGYKTSIIPYVITLEGITTTFHKKYRSELNLDCRTQAYIQARVLKMTLEIIAENEQEVTKKENLISNTCENRLISICDDILKNKIEIPLYSK
ncbi:hypothetical protein NAPIS_ORF02734 [Vairimorpha apis BRL 01]|uniref:Uncharacterized protein n=1 Tax=Vairimorpha apis BRL 01 TaxID=1037528 RepID=T0KW18_9MICR|nr:hypothetical protein NAPIS_ORF02734 [Vairimorpha apis BRL 01]